MNATAEKKWIDDFTLELRLREVRGDAIGDAVASVKELLADTGQAPEQAFGSPREYAEQLDLPTVKVAGINAGSTIAPALGVLALLAYVPAAWAFFGNKPLEYSLPQVLLLAVPLVLALTLPLYINWLLRHLWGFVMVFGISSATAVGVALLKPEEGSAPWLQADALAVAAISGLALLAAATWGAIDTARTPNDPIIDPQTAPRKSSKAIHILSSALAHALMPAYALGNTVVAWLMNR